MVTRREFLGSSVAAMAAAGLAPRALGLLRPDAKLKILILGGTGFLGPACSEAAVAKGHTVTLFNRGRTERRRKGAGRPSNVPDGVEILYGNRDPNKTADDDNNETETKDPNSPKGLSQLEGKKWDAVIDTSGYFPRMVDASATLLAPSVKQYVFISSVSVYTSQALPGNDESSELAVLKDPKTESFGSNFENYGAGKAASEAAAEKAMPGRVANIRPGFIVGPRDTSQRFAFWPIRVEKGGEMAVPGTPTDPIQIIDVRDLAEWIVRLIETNTNGVFNATGPEQPLTMLEMVQGCKKAAKSDTTFTWIDEAFLTSQSLSDNDFPLWVPATGKEAGIHQTKVAKAVAAGLKFRSVEETAKATLDWYHSLPEEFQKRQAKLLPPEREEAVLKAWKEKK